MSMMTKWLKSDQEENSLARELPSACVFHIGHTLRLVTGRKVSRVGEPRVKRICGPEEAGQELVDASSAAQ